MGPALGYCIGDGIPVHTFGGLFRGIMAEEIGLLWPMENVSGIPFDSNSGSGYILRFHLAAFQSRVRERVVARGFLRPELWWLNSQELAAVTGARVASVHCGSWCWPATVGGIESIFGNLKYVMQEWHLK